MSLTRYLQENIETFQGTKSDSQTNLDRPVSNSLSGLEGQAKDGIERIN